MIGQADFTTAADGGCTQRAATPRAVAASNGVLYVRDSNNRALGWAPLPALNNAAATLVIGNTSFTDCTGGGIDPIHVGPTGDLTAANGKFLLSDATRDRILLWSPAPAVDGDPAERVLGQPDYTTEGAGNAAEQLADPAGIWTDGTRIVVADRANNRVLIWMSYPAGHGEPADLVLGQSDFGTSQAPTTPSQSNLKAPSSVFSDGTRLFVSDSSHNRVLIWNTFPTVNGAPADVVLGQDSFTTGGSGLSATALYQPRGLAATSDALFVADTTNDRVVVYSPIPMVSGTAATFVLGQPDLDVGADQPPPSERSLAAPFGLSITGETLWVADFGHKRVLRFTLYPDP